MKPEVLKPIPEPGMFTDIPFEAYQKWDAVNHSMLKQFNKSPAHAQAAQMGMSSRTDAMIFGHQVHCALFEPEVFRERYVEQPSSIKVRRGKTWDEFKQRHGEENILRPGRQVEIQTICSAVMSNPSAAELVKKCLAYEVSLVWDSHRYKNIRCKGRIDGYCPELSAVVDLKTTVDASKFTASAFRYSYHTQAAMYLQGLRELGGGCSRFVIIAIEKDEPYGVRLFEFNEEVLRDAEDVLDSWLAQCSFCIETGNWHGYSQTIELIRRPVDFFTEIEDVDVIV